MAVYKFVERHGPGAGPIVPAISPRTDGPLGIVQFPRLWLTCLLRAADMLPNDDRLDDDRGGNGVLERLGVDPLVARSFVEDERPSYLAYEAWIERIASTIDAATIDRINAELRPNMVRSTESYDREVLHHTFGLRRPVGGAAHPIGIPAFAHTDAARGAT